MYVRSTYVFTAASLNSSPDKSHYRWIARMGSDFVATANIAGKRCMSVFYPLRYINKLAVFECLSLIKVSDRLFDKTIRTCSSANHTKTKQSIIRAILRKALPALLKKGLQF